MWGWTLLSLGVTHHTFAVDAVRHVVNVRFPYSRRQPISYGDLEGFTQLVAPTTIPDQVVFALTESGLHLFLHDGVQFRRCSWDGVLPYEGKRKVIADMIAWMEETNQTPQRLGHFCVNAADGVLFADVLGSE
jgi:hypothetical protein